MCFMCLYLHVKAFVEKAFLVDEISMIYNVTRVDTHIICLPVGEYFTTIFRMPIRHCGMNNDLRQYLEHL